jgi:hypothetical protein
MKKTLQIISFIGLAFIFGGVTANAQSLSKTFDADIPFDFAIGGKALSAGKYKLRIAGQQNGVKLLEIRNTKRELLYMGLMSENGERLNDSAELRFDTETGRLSLARIVTENAGFTIPETKRSKLVAASKKSKDGNVNN